MACPKCNSDNLKVIETKHHSGFICLDCGDTQTAYYRGQCCATPNKIKIRFEQVNGTIVQRVACSNCKKMINGAVKKDEGFNTYKLLTQKRHLEIQEEYSEDGKLFYELINDARNDFRTQNHDEWLRLHTIYLGTPQWRILREKILKRDDYTCRGCLTARATQVHHTTYAHWRQELAFELISLCEACHDKIHDAQTR